MGWSEWLAAGAAALGGVSQLVGQRRARDADNLSAQSRSEWAQWNYDQDTRRTLLQADTAKTRADVDREKARLEGLQADIALATAGLTRDRAAHLEDQADFTGVRAAEALRSGQLGAQLKAIDNERIRAMTRNELQGLDSSFAANDAAFEASRAQLSAQWEDRNLQYEDAIADIAVGAATAGVAGASVAAVSRRLERKQARDREVYELQDASLSARSLEAKRKLRSQRAGILLRSAYQQRINDLQGDDYLQRATVAAEGIEIEGEGITLRGLGALLDARRYDLQHGAHTLAADNLTAGALLGERSALEAIEGLNSRPEVLDYAAIARSANSAWGDVGSFLSGAASGASLLMTGRELWGAFRNG